MFGLMRERKALSRSLEERARGMLAGGMMQEVRRLLAAGHDETAPGMAGIGYRQMVAVIGGRETVASIRLHEALGFAHVGVFPAVGFKFGRWIDIVLMQRALGPGAASLPG